MTSSIATWNPNVVSLESIRIESLNLGAEYVWLDILSGCLRQGENEQMEEECPENWRLELSVPGSHFTCTVPRLILHVAIYHSGLGRPFVVGDLESPRHWLCVDTARNTRDPHTITIFPKKVENLDLMTKSLIKSKRCQVMNACKKHILVFVASNTASVIFIVSIKIRTHIQYI